MPVCRARAHVACAAVLFFGVFVLKGRRSDATPSKLEGGVSRRWLPRLGKAGRLFSKLGKPVRPRTGAPGQSIFHQPPHDSLDVEAGD